MVKLGRTCAVLSVRHTIFHCLCLICVTQPGAEGLRKYDWYAMPRSHHECFPLWSVHNIVDRNTAAMLRQLDLDFPNEADTYPNEPDKMSNTSETNSDNNLLLEEEEDMQFLMVEESEQTDVVDSVTSPQRSVAGPSHFIPEVPEGASSEEAQAPIDIPTRKISYAHHRSQSDSQALGISSLIKASTSPPKTSRGNGSGTKEPVTATPASSSVVPIKQRTVSTSSSGAYGSFRGRVSSFFGGGKSSGAGSAPSTSGTSYQRSNSGSFKWRRSRSDSASESITSGVSSGDSVNVAGHGSHQSILLHGGRPAKSSSYVPEHGPALSTIPSSASITECSNPPSQNDRNQMSPQSKGNVKAYIHHLETKSFSNATNSLQMAAG